MAPTPSPHTTWDWKGNGSPTTQSPTPSMCDGHRDGWDDEVDIPSGDVGTGGRPFPTPEIVGDSPSESTSATTTLPAELIFNEDSVGSIAAYCTLLVISTLGNLIVIASLIRLRHRKSRVAYLLTHLAVADLMVTFVMIPVEICWRATTQCLAGNIACSVFHFVREFGIYLSSLVISCLTLGRYFDVVHHLRLSDSRHRATTMMCVAWAVALVCAFPQCVMFHVSRHPESPNFIQSTSLGFFHMEIVGKIYSLFSVFVTYLVPLFIFFYTCIVLKFRNTPAFARADIPTTQEQNANVRLTFGGAERCRGATGDSSAPSCSATPRFHLRCNIVSNKERSRSRTLRMTVNIVLVFICCRTPYFVMTLWYTFHRESGKMVESRVQEVLFITAVSNACINPFVYGTYVFNVWRQCSRLSRSICAKSDFLKQCRCSSCVYVCRKSEDIPETIVMDVVPRTIGRQSRRQFPPPCLYLPLLQPLPLPAHSCLPTGDNSLLLPLPAPPPCLFLSLPIPGFLQERIPVLRSGSQQPQAMQESISTVSTMLTTNVPGEYQGFNDSQVASYRTITPVSERYPAGSGLHYHRTLTPEHSSALSDTTV